MQSLNKPSTTNAVVAGLFYDMISVELATKALIEAGFAPGNIEQLTAEVGQRDDNNGGFFNSLAKFFGGGDSEDGTNPITTADGTSAYNRLITLGLDQEEAHEFQSRLEDGGVLVILHAGARATKALEIFKHHGASPAQLEFDENPPTKIALPSQAESDVTMVPHPVAEVMLPVIPQPEIATPGTQRLQLLKEVLKVNKERVQKGEVRVRKEIITEMRTLEVPVTREELVIERQVVVDGRVTGEISEGETIRIPLSEEQVRVDKQAVVAEEVTIGKRDVEEIKEVKESVRREELRTETDGSVIVNDQNTPMKP